MTELDRRRLLGGGLLSGYALAVDARRFFPVPAAAAETGSSKGKAKAAQATS